MLSSVRLRIAAWPWHARLALRLALTLLVGTPFVLYILDANGWLYPGRRWMGMTGEFHCYAPKELKRQPVQPIDSVVLVSSSPTMRLSFDLGLGNFGQRESISPRRVAAAPANPYVHYPNYQERETTIGGHPAVLYTYEDPREQLGGRYVTGIRIPRLPHGRSLSGMMVSKFPDGRDAAVETFATLSFP